MKSHDSLKLALATLRYCLTIVCLTVVLWANASDFDMTEGKTIGIMAAVVAASEGIPFLVKNKNDKSDE